jgi:hypothetical protein
MSETQRCRARGSVAVGTYRTHGRTWARHRPAYRAGVEAAAAAISGGSIIRQPRDRGNESGVMWSRDVDERRHRHRMPVLARGVLIDRTGSLGRLDGEKRSEPRERRKIYRGQLLLLLAARDVCLQRTAAGCSASLLLDRASSCCCAVPSSFGR